VAIGLFVYGILQATATEERMDGIGRETKDNVLPEILH
jgi:hypothetical protein